MPVALRCACVLFTAASHAPDETDGSTPRHETLSAGAGAELPLLPLLPSIHQAGDAAHPTVDQSTSRPGSAAAGEAAEASVGVTLRTELARAMQSPPTLR